MTPGVSQQGGSARIERPLFTIVTSSFNQGQFLEQTIESVIAQGRADVEHIIFDGGSTDNSVDVLRQYDHSLAYWVSKRDKGQSSAWNAGVRRARGEIIAFLNSDDLYLTGGLDAIADLARRRADAEWFVGGTRYFGDDAPRLSYPGIEQSTPADVLFFESYAPQPGHFFRRSLAERVGPFDESLHFSFDLDFFVRCALAGARSAATLAMVAAFRFHGASKTVSQRASHRAETDAVEDRYWPEIQRQYGSYARRLRTKHKGHLALESVREAVASGEHTGAWGGLAQAVVKHPGIVFTRAFAGTVQRLLRLRK